MTPELSRRLAASSGPGGCATAGVSSRLTRSTASPLGKLPRHRRHSGFGGARSASRRLLISRSTPFVARGAGTGLSGGALADKDQVLLALTRLNQILKIDPAAAGPMVEPGVVNARLTEAARPTGSTTPPIPPARPPAPWAATWRRTPADPTASSTASPPTTSWRSRSCCPTARSVRLGRRHGEPWGPTSSACSSAARACSASRPRSRCGLIRLPTSVRTLLADFDRPWRRARPSPPSSPPGSCPPRWR